MLPVGPGSASTPASPRAMSSPGVRLDDRQGHRLGERPRRGARPPAPGAGADGRHRQRRDDEQVVPARPARAPEVRRGDDRHRLARSTDRCRRGRALAPRRRRPRRRRPRRRRSAAAPSIAAGSSAGPAAVDRSSTPDTVTRSSCATAPPRTASSSAAGRPRRSSSVARAIACCRRRRRAAGSSRSAADDRSDAASPWCRRSTGPTTSSRWTASPTGSPATTPASCVPRRPPWSSASTSAPATSSTPGDRVAVVEAMKMEIAIAAPISGTVADVFVARNVQVDGGAPLLRIEPRRLVAGDDDGSRRSRSTTSGPRGRLPTATDRPASRRCGRSSSASTSRSLPPDGGAPTSPRCDPPTSWRPPSCTSSPISALAPERQPVDGDDESGRPCASTSTSTCARSTPSARASRRGSSSDRNGPSPTTGSTRSPPRAGLEDALMRIFIAQQRVDEQRASSRRSWSVGSPPTPEADDRLRDALDRSSRRRSVATRRWRASPAGSPPSVRPAARSSAIATRSPRRRCASTSLALVGADGSSPDGRRPTRRPRSPAPAADSGVQGEAVCSPRRTAPSALLGVLMRRYYKIRDLGP